MRRFDAYRSITPILERFARTEDLGVATRNLQAAANGLLHPGQSPKRVEAIVAQTLYTSHAALAGCVANALDARRAHVEADRPETHLFSIHTPQHWGHEPCVEAGRLLRAIWSARLIIQPAFDPNAFLGHHLLTHMLQHHTFHVVSSNALVCATLLDEPGFWHVGPNQGVLLARRRLWQKDQDVDDKPLAVVDHHLRALLDDGVWIKAYLDERRNIHGLCALAQIGGTSLAAQALLQGVVVRGTILRASSHHQALTIASRLPAPRPASTATKAPYHAQVSEVLQHHLGG